MKRTALIVLMIATLSLALFACGGDETKAATETSKAGSSCGTMEASKPFGYSLAMKPVSKMPDWKRG